MRHKRKDKKLGRSSAHRKAMISSMVCSLIMEKRIKTTQAKAKLARSLAEKMVTIGRRGTFADKRLALKNLNRKDAVEELFTKVAPSFEGRAGGYTRIMKLGRRRSDSSEMVILEWVEAGVPAKKDAPAAVEAEAEVTA